MIFNTFFKNYLNTKKILDEVTLNELTTKADDKGIPLFIELTNSKLIEEEVVFKLLADFLNIPYHTFLLTEVNFDLVNKFEREKLIEYQTMPYSENEQEVIFAISNPFRIEDIQEFKANVNKTINVFLLAPSKINQLISYVDNKIQQNSVLNEYSAPNKDISDAKGSEVDGVAIDAPIIKLCDSILKDAVSRGASDIHIEPFEEFILLRFRIDGKLIIVDKIAITLFQSLIARFKIMAGMNIAERRVPQDGKINLSIENKEYDFRVSTMPTINGEKLVIRIYNINLSGSNFSLLGLNKKQEFLVKNMISKPHGIILLTGPTGSGKSTTLYTFLRYLNRVDTNIITVEDPVENQIDGINQVQVNPKADLTFANALRSILRQDPNIIMIGEIRDEETAQIATRAAITGHLVLSTIHTNDAAGVVTRLINMGIPKYLVADALVGAISQRLVRRLCPNCKKPHKTNKVENEILGLEKSKKIFKPHGCRLCNHTGYIGRVGVFEILVCDDEVKEVIMSDDYNSSKLNDVLIKKSTSLLMNAKERVLKGETSIDEYERLNDVIKEMLD